MSAEGGARSATALRCPDCGSADVVESLRDGPTETAAAFGHWITCQECGFEWQPDGGRHGEGRKEATDG